jgi:hypothetical protein
MSEKVLKEIEHEFGKVDFEQVGSVLVPFDGVELSARRYRLETSPSTFVWVHGEDWGRL